MPKTTQSALSILQASAALNVSKRIDDGRLTSAQPKYAEIVVNIDPLNVQADVITLFQLPEGSYVLPALSQIIVTDDMTTGALTIHIGDVVAPSRYCISANCATPGVVRFIDAAATVFPAGLLTHTKVVKSRTAALDTSVVTATLATFAATIEAGQFVVILAYVTL